MLIALTVYTPSHPAWGEWIEIFIVMSTPPISASHPAWGEWIEIHWSAGPRPALGRLTPHGVSGLKSPGAGRDQPEAAVSPRMG